MNYKIKYLKYKNKYLSLKKQHGGFMKKKINIILDGIQPDTLSNIFMPIILAPFENVNVIINNDIEKSLLQHNAPTFELIIKLLRQYYIKKNINLSNVYNLWSFYHFDDAPFHITGEAQEQLLYNDANLESKLTELIFCIYNSDTKHNFIGKNITVEVIGNIYGD